MRFGRAFIILALGLFTPDATVRGQGPDAAASAGGGTRVRRVVEAARVGGQAPVIDGRLDDPTWAQAAVAGRFIQFAPRPGAPSAQRTEARVLFDEQAIYVGMRLFDTAPDSIAGQLARRDLTGGYNDWAQVVIDSYNDRRTAFRFGVNPRGVQKDVFHYNDREEGVGWDAVWESATQLDSLGWTAEFRIPLSQLRFSARGRAEQGGEQVWGIQFIRDIARSSERSYWSPNSPDVPGFVSQFGELRGIRGVASPGRIELVPYSVARMTAAPGDDADPFHRENDFAGSLGADLKYGVTSDLTLTTTINPDFGQVEADPSQVNLTAFETFFEERRPFFVEGSDIFRFDIAFPYFVRGAFFRNDQPFYPRRVGRTPQGDVPDEAIYSDAPDATTILGAAKLSGKTASGWSIGVLEAVTADERARYTDSLGVRQRVLLEPLTNYAVVRPIKDFRQGQSAIGGIVTATNRHLDDVTAEFLRSGAYTAGVDVRHQFGTDGKYQLKGAVLASHVRGSAEAISDVQLASGHFFDRPDADHLDYDSTRTSLTGLAADIKFEKRGGGHWFGGVYGHARSPGFEMNDVGFSRNADWLLQGSWLGYFEFRPGRLFRQWELNVNQWNGWSTGGERLTTGVNVNGFGQLNNLWRGFFGLDHEFPAWSADALRGGPLLRAPMHTNGNFGIFTDARRPVSGEIEVNVFREYGTGSWSLGVSPGVTLRLGGQMDVTFRPRFEDRLDAWGYVDEADDAAGETHYVFGRLEQTTVSLTTRLNYTFTPRLSLQFYGQPFVSGGDYSSFMEVEQRGSDRFTERFRAVPEDALSYRADAEEYDVAAVGALRGGGFSFENPDFNVREFRSTAVLRWEYRPGSTLFVVWSQGREDSGAVRAFRFGHDTRRLFDTEPTNVLLVKLSYWLNP